MRVFITGATGYVGQAVLTSCLNHGHKAVILARKGSVEKLPSHLRDHQAVTVAEGDVLDPQSLMQGMNDCDAVVHLVGIIREKPKKGITFQQAHVDATRNIVAASRAKGVQRYVHMSALGVKKGSASLYQHTKALAEELVQESDLSWTIFRPSVIFGPRDEFVNMLANALRFAPAFPVFGSGQYRLQPVALENVADAMAMSLGFEHTHGQTYDVGGPLSYTYDEILDEIGAAIGKKRTRKLHTPLPLVKPIVRMLEGYSAFPVTTAQLLMLLEGNTCNPGPFFETFQLVPIPFGEGIRAYLRKK